MRTQRLRGAAAAEAEGTRARPARCRGNVRQRKTRTGSNAKGGKPMNQIIYLVGLVVVIGVLLSFLGIV
ncbi:MAG: hypothetical protein AB7U38_06875 [Hyphomicrobiales bacterium]